MNVPIFMGWVARDHRCTNIDPCHTSKLPSKDHHPHQPHHFSFLNLVCASLGKRSICSPVTHIRWNSTCTSLRTSVAMFQRSGHFDSTMLSHLNWSPEYTKQRNMLQHCKALHFCLAVLIMLNDGYNIHNFIVAQSGHILAVNRTQSRDHVVFAAQVPQCSSLRPADRWWTLKQQRHGRNQTISNAFKQE